MFNFTTQTVLNQITGNFIDHSQDGKKPYVRIANIRFDVPEEGGSRKVLDVTKKLWSPSNFASVTFNLGTITAPTDADAYFRLYFYVGLTMDGFDPYFANALTYKGKPITLEFVWKKNETADKVAKRIKKTADKFQIFAEQRKFFNVTVNGANITFTALMDYLILKEAKLQQYDATAKPIDCCTSEGDYFDVMWGVPATYKFKTADHTWEIENKKFEDGELKTIESPEVPIAPGISAFCDYNWIIRNLRLPTYANTNFWSVNAQEMPVAGGKYNQYIVRLCADRDNIAGEVVGQRARSVTTHVFYVLDCDDPELSKFEEALKAVAGQQNFLIEADTKFGAPFGK